MVSATPRFALSCETTESCESRPPGMPPRRSRFWIRNPLTGSYELACYNPTIPGVKRMDTLSRLMKAIRERLFSDTDQATWCEVERSTLQTLGYPERDFRRLLSVANEQHQRSFETRRVLRGVPTNQIVREMRALQDDQVPPKIIGW
jgi:hypothetical protein